MWLDECEEEKKQNTAERGDVEKQTSNVKGYGVTTIADQCCSVSDSKFVLMKHKTNVAYYLTKARW